MIVVRVTEQNDVDFAEARIVRSHHRLSRIVKDARSVRIFEDHGPVSIAELTVMAAERRDFHIRARGRGRLRSETEQTAIHRQEQYGSMHACCLPCGPVWKDRHVPFVLSPADALRRVPVGQVAPVRRTRQSSPDRTP